jgi:hypothetical protein
LQPVAITQGAFFGDGSLRGLTPGYGGLENNGNLLTLGISGAGLTASLGQSYTYDSVNRVAKFTEGSTSQQFGYTRTAI